MLFPVPPVISAPEAARLKDAGLKPFPLALEPESVKSTVEPGNRYHVPPLHRQDSSAQGHWMSPDPYGGSYDVYNPRSFNRYAYTLNNPLSLIDPSGLDGCDGVQWGNGCVDGGGCTMVVSAQHPFSPMAPCGAGTGPDGGSGNDGGGNGGGSGGGTGPNAPSNTVSATSKTPAQQQCLANTQADYNQAVSRAWDDANDTFYETAGGAVVGGAIGGCVAGAVPTAGLGCVPGGLIGGLGGLAGGVPTGIWLGGRSVTKALSRAKQDYNTAAQRCSQQP
jgi:hypothetical protein